ncbi:MAG: hypothetical protein HN356_15515 [Calditrichaeota bacterium]|nr:hypothetical protein [Calditrichota bacterium]
MDSEISEYVQSNPALRDGRAGMTDLLGRGEVLDVRVILSGEGISTLNPLCSG